jgi:hypothetical protein
MKDHQRSTGRDGRADQRARILWRDEDTGEQLWLVLNGTHEFFEELGRAGYDLRRLPEAARPVEVRLEPNAA